MSLQIMMLGTGSAFSKKYFNNNAIVYCNDYTLLVDCGITAPLSMYQAGVEIDEIDGILITHLHADHIGGIEELAFQLKYKYSKKITLFLPVSLQDILWEQSLKAGMDTGEENCGLHTYFNIVTIEENVKTEICSGFEVEIIRTPHVPKRISYSLLFNNNLFYSADMCFNKPLIESLHSKCKYLLHDCQLQEPGIVHTTLNELLTLPEAIQEKIQLMHYGDNMESYIGKTGKMTFMRQHKMYDYT